MPNMHTPKVCAICGKQATSGWNLHWKRHHLGQNKKQLVNGLQPQEPWHINWLDKLDTATQAKYTLSARSKAQGEINFPSPVRENSMSDQQTNFKQFYGYSTTGRDKCFNISSSGTHFFEENKKSAQPNSFSTNYVTDWDKLSRTCSSMSQMSEAAKLLLQEKDGQLIQLKERMQRLESRLETKDCELIQLRGQVGGLEVQSLKIELAVVKSQLFDRDILLKEWKQKEQEWLNMFGQVYNLSKDPSFYKDLKKALEEFQGSLQNSKVNSLRGSCNNSRDNSEPIIQTQGDNQQMDESQLANTNTSQEVFESESESIPEYGFDCKAASNLPEDINKGGPQFTQQIFEPHEPDKNKTKTREEVCVTCKFCNKAIVGPQISWEIDSVIPAGALIDHMKQCSKFLAYQSRINMFSKDWKEQLTKQDALLQTQLSFALESADDMVQTLRLSKVFQHNQIHLQTFLSKWKYGKNKISLPELQTANAAFGDIFELYKKIYPMESYYHKSEGYMQWNTEGTLVDMTSATQLSNLLKIKMDTVRYRCLTCEKMFACEAGWQEHGYYSKLNNQKDCRCDVFKEGRYSYSIDYGNFIQRQRLFKGKEEREELEALIKKTYVEQPTLVSEPKRQKTSLEERRISQQNINRMRFKENKACLAKVEKWLLELKEKFSSAGKLTKIGAPICDAIILPRCTLLFGESKKHNSNMEAFLKEFLPVQGVFKSQRKKDQCVLVQLTDARNAFTVEFLAKLKAAISALIDKTISRAKELQYTKEQINEVVATIYVRQIDYTQDLSGFFMSFDIKSDLATLSEALGIGHSTEYTQTSTLFQFTEADKDKMLQRIKIYNKWVHLMTCGQFKKSLSMNVRKLLKPTLEFYMDKMTLAMELGLTRIEQSVYFNSRKDWESLGNDLSMFETQINSTLTALNDMKERVAYHINFKDFWQSFWDVIDEHVVLISFEPDAWAVCYAFCKNSSLYSGCEVDRHSKSGSMLAFLKRFAGKHTIVFIREKQFTITKHGQIRQIPVESLNSMHNKDYDGFPIDFSKFAYHLSEEQLTAISFTCDDPEFYEFFGERPDMSVFENQLGQPVDANEQLSGVDIPQRDQNDRSTDNNGEQTSANYPQNKKREVKFHRKEEAKETIKDKNKGLASEMEQWKKKGKHRGKQRWECLKCGYRTINTDNLHPCS